MATPDFSGDCGVALMRQWIPTGEWWFVSWVASGGTVDIVTEIPGPGTWAYALWLILGTNAQYNAQSVIGAGYHGKATVVVQQLKR